MNSLFDNLENRFKLDKPVRLIELFAGIGAQAKALENLGVNFEHYRVCEIDKYAIASYNAIHGTNFEISDITKLSSNDLGIIDTTTYIYILTYSFPCQDLSLAGKQQGMKKGTQTRSGLLWEVERLLKGCKELPQVLLMENVPQVHSSKNYEDFKDWQNFLSNLGYQNTWADLNAKNYGIPQNRNRTFMVSILGNSPYEFPEPFPLNLKLKDLLEDNVDEKYYLSEKQINGIVNSSFAQKCNFIQNTECCGTLLARDRKDPKCVAISSSIPIKENTIKGYAIASYGDSVNLEQPNSKTRRGRVGFKVANTLTTNCNQGVVVLGNYSPSNHNASRIVDSEGIAPTVMENHGTITATIVKRYLPIGVVVNKDSENYIQWKQKGSFDISCRTYKEDKISGTVTTCEVMKILTNDLAIRKLTPKEYWRLMGFDDEDFEKASKVNSNTQLYKQAGNSIVVNVLMEIFRKMG